MRCPVDGTEMALSERVGVEVYVCPLCNGVWLSSEAVAKIVSDADAKRERHGTAADETAEPLERNPDLRTRRGGRSADRGDIFSDIFDIFD
ncbi:MAG: zf-TFIIB domain-containing protein [Pseudomonadota bacterium]